MYGGVGFLGAYMGTDAVSGASELVDAPSGSFYVIINTSKHNDPDKLTDWTKFFSGEEVSYIFEDISVVAAMGDNGALQLADSYRSKLPENQMTIREEDPILMMSKGAVGRFDIMIISREYAEVFAANDVMERPDSLVLDVESV